MIVLKKRRLKPQSLLTKKFASSAIVFSVIETVKANGLDAKKYLTYLFDNRPDENMTDEQLEAFAPWNEDVRKACVNNVE